MESVLFNTETGHHPVVRHQYAMKGPWYYKPLTAIAVAFVCLLIGWLSNQQGYLTFRLFGLDFGFAHLKSFFYFVWFGNLHKFPLHSILNYTALVATGLAMYFTFERFSSRSSDF
jgi:ABC-type polysaccharide/polyol phosphate export permease